MNPADGHSPRRPAPADFWLSYGLLVALVVAWVALAFTLPRAVPRTLTVDITCRSGNSVVGVWIEATAGGSGWASAGVQGTAKAARYTFSHGFGGDYQVRAGCGGTADNWAVRTASDTRGDLYRRLDCDDTRYLPPDPAVCTDVPAG